MAAKNLGKNQTGHLQKKTIGDSNVKHFIIFSTNYSEHSGIDFIEHMFLYLLVTQENG